jgi:hypothetical protein
MWDQTYLMGADKVEKAAESVATLVKVVACVDQR